MFILIYLQRSGRNSKKFGILGREGNKGFFGPSHPFIIVKKITKEIIEKTIQAYAQEYNEYWLKLYHFAGEINM
jgi:hypothetical protein